MPASQTFDKQERLCSRRLITTLFEHGRSFFEFPFRVVLLEVEADELFADGRPCQLLISVSKRHFKKAVQRNRIKRLVREGWRKNKHPLYDALNEKNSHLAVALIYTGRKLPEFHRLETKIIQIIDRLTQEIINRHDK